MPPLTRWFIKTSLVYFVLALTTGLLLAAAGVWKLSIPSGGLFPAYFHLLAEGWITLLIMGVVFWMFPKFSRQKPRGNERVGWAAFILINAGLVLRLISEPAITLHPGAVWGWLLVVAAVLQWLGGMAFVVNSWGRVKEK